MIAVLLLSNALTLFVAKNVEAATDEISFQAVNNISIPGAASWYYGYKPLAIDVNGDTNLDLVTANYDANNISILIGNGDGTFDSPVNYAAGNLPTYVTSVQLGGDAHLDLFVLNYGGSNISVFTGNGDGTFDPAVNYAVGDDPSGPAVVGDFNGDTFQDIAIGNATTTDVSILIGNGDGTLDSAVNYAVGNFPLSVYSGDFNEDGEIDLISLDSGFEVLIGVGDGTFTNGFIYSTADFIDMLPIIDNVNGDAFEDILIVNATDDVIEVHIGNGDGTFDAPVNYGVGNVAILNPSLQDVNGDTFEDLVVANYSDNDVSVLLGNGDGTFDPKVDYAVGTNPNTPPHVIDINDDGEFDIVIANATTDNLTVLLGNGDGTFDTAENFALDDGPAYDLTIADLNNDGLLDVVVPNDNGANTLSVLTNNTGTTSITWTNTADFERNAVVGPDLEFGTGDDGTNAVATTIDDARTTGDEVKLSSLGFLQATAGDYYTNAGIKTDGTLWTAGDSFIDLSDPASDQLCLGAAATQTLSHTQVGTDNDWVYVNAGFDQTHMIKSDGTLWGCGEDEGGQVGAGAGLEYSTPVQIGTDNDWEAVWGADWHTIGKKTDGTLWAWGADWCGNLGQGTEDVQQNSPVQIGTDTDWDMVSAGDTHNLATKTDGTLWGWGCDYTPGELGQGNNPDYAIEVPTQIGTDSDWAYVSAGFLMSAAIKDNGTLWTFGEGYGLGHGDFLPRNVPTQVGVGTDWANVSVGFFHFTAQKDDGSLWSWGQGDSGELGLGDILDRSVPTLVSSDTDWASFTAGGQWSMALKDDGTMWTTGRNTRGALALGLAHGTIVTTLTEVPGASYNVLGTVSGLKTFAGAGNEADWDSLRWNTSALPAGTEVRFRVRTSADDITYSAWSSYFTQDIDGSTSGSADLSSIPNAEYIEIELSFTSTDDLVTPTLAAFTLDYQVAAASPATAPTVTSAAASSITDTAASLNGEITDIGSQAPTERGFEYGLDNTYGTTVSDVGSFGTGVFNESITGLTCNTLYHFRAFAESPDGTGNGADTTFTTSACPVTPPSGGSSGSQVTPEEIIPPVIVPIITPIIAPVITPIINPIVNPPFSGGGSSGAPQIPETPTTPVEEGPNPVTPEPTFTPVENPTGGSTAQTPRGDGGNIFERILSDRETAAQLALLSSVNLVLLLALLPISNASNALSMLASIVPLGISGFGLIYTRYIQNLLSFLGLRKKRRVWGTVYDSQTKQPLDPAVVELIDATTGEVKERAITDLAGRFGFLAANGNFVLRASKTHYAFPSVKESGQTDEIFENLYHGEPLVLTEGSTVVTPNIPMDPIGFDWNQEAKQKLLPSRLRWQYVLHLLFNTLFIFGLVFAVYNIFNSFGLWNLIVLALYILILLFRFIFKPKHLWGLITKSGKALSGAYLEVTESQMGVVMGRALSATDGKFFLKVPQPGYYNLSVKDKKDGRLISQSEVSIGKDSVLNQDIVL